MFTMYPKPNDKNSINGIRLEIEKDYNALASKYSFPKIFSFTKVTYLVSKGMPTEGEYPFKKLQFKFMEYVLNNVDNESEVNKIIGTFMAIWNYFPHDDMGMAPVEVSAENSLLEDEENIDVFEILDELLLDIKDVVDEKIYRQGKKIGLLKKESKQIIDILSKPSIDPSQSLEKLFLILRNKKTNKIVTMEDIQPFVRAVSFAENHTPAKLDNNHYTSRMLQELARGSVQSVSGQPGKIKYVNPALLLSVIHETIELVQNDGGELNADKNHIDTSHHLLNWVVDVDDFSYISNYSPDVLSALLLGSSNYITRVVTPDEYISYSDSDIYLLIKNEFESLSDYQKEVKEMTQKILKTCSDPLMCVPDIIRAPDDYIDRLREIVPGLKKLRDDDDIPQGFIPSPYLGL